MKNITRVGVAAVAAGALVGALGFSLASAENGGQEKPEVGKSQTVTEQGQTYTIERGYTASGQTYGSELDPEYGLPMPDFVAVEATNGKVGYVNYAEQEKARAMIEPASPGEQPARESVPLPVYAKDGKTVIGEFVLGELGPNFEVVERTGE